MGTSANEVGGRAPKNQDGKCACETQAMKCTLKKRGGVPPEGNIRGGHL